MVTTPDRAWRLPTAPSTIGAQIEAAFTLWRRSAWPALPFALLYTLAGLLPLLTLGAIQARLLQTLGDFMAFAFDPARVPPPEGAIALHRALAAWAVSPATLALTALSLLLALYAATGVLLRLQGVAGGHARGLGAEAWLALRRLPAAFAAWLVYALVMLGCAALVAGFAAMLSVWAMQLELGGLLVLLVFFVLGSLVLSIPLAWASVAFGYAPLLATFDGLGPFRAHGLSARLVSGHWVRAATGVTVPLLVYLGLGSLVSSLAYAGLGLAAYAGGGWEALAGGRWLFWAPWLTALPMALCLPLGLAGLVVTLHDLRRRNQAPP